MTFVVFVVLFDNPVISVLLAKVLTASEVELATRLAVSSTFTLEFFSTSVKVSVSLSEDRRLSLLVLCATRAGISGDSVSSSRKFHNPSDVL